MLRATTMIRTLLVLGGIGAAIAAAEPAAAQGLCIPGWYYNPIYGCLVDGDAYLPRRIIPPHHLYAHPYGPSSGFAPHDHMAQGGYVPERSFSSPHAYVPPVSSSSGFSMNHSGEGFRGVSLGGASLGHGSFGGGGGGFGGGGFGGGGFGGGHGR